MISLCFLPFPFLFFIFISHPNRIHAESDRAYGRSVEGSGGGIDIASQPSDLNPIGRCPMQADGRREGPVIATCAPRGSGTQHVTAVISVLFFICFYPFCVLSSSFSAFVAARFTLCPCIFLFFFSLYTLFVFCPAKR